MAMMKRETPIDFDIVTQKINESGLKSIGKASIREIKQLVDEIQNATGKRFIRMEMGIPGLPPSEIGVRGQVEALEKGVAAIYPNIQGIPELKTECSRFLKLFMDIDIQPGSCIPTVGSMQGSFAAFLTLSRTNKQRTKTLFIDPGFPVHKQQHQILGLQFETFDVYEYRGEKLKEKLDSYFKEGDIHSVMYSNPNNPSWICFTEEELRIIGELANEYGIIVLEDLAYFAMDFRKNYSVPGQPPFQPTVAKYTENYILLISSSKVFSYAGERIGMMAISDALYNKRFPGLKEFYASDQFGYVMIFGTVYALSAGTSHSAQHALAAMFKAANDGDFDFLEPVKEYGVKAGIMKKMFTDNGFKIVYDKDLDVPIADGFYFTFSYPGFDAEALLHELVYYGISAISLLITGSERKEGIRACTSLIQNEQLPELEERLHRFYLDHPING
jgi:aspartate/methionine/tyrosine aminotransferase